MLEQFKQITETIFLSTLSLRRATFQRIAKPFREQFISIHALLAESDEQSASYNEYLAEFLSTLSLRRATSTSL